MNILQLPWLETSVAVALFGALFVSRLGNPSRASRWGIGFTGTVLGCTLLASLGFYLGTGPERGSVSAGRCWGSIRSAHPWCRRWPYYTS